VLEEAHDNEELIERVAALDIGKAQLVCCVRVPGQGKRARRLQEVKAYPTMKDLTAGCGCWRSAPGPTSRNLFLARNLLLLTLAVVGTLGATSPDPVQALAVLPMAVLLALIILELPTIGAMVLSERGQRAAR
jgi:hypothetical protein